jgi:hypothetical protein
MLLEVGEPHVCSLPPASGSTTIGAPSLVVRNDGFVRRDKLWRGAGVAIPVFSLRSKDSVGVGEFMDLIKLVDLADASGMRLIQVGEGGVVTEHAFKQGRWVATRLHAGPGFQHVCALDKCVYTQSTTACWSTLCSHVQPACRFQLLTDLSLYTCAMLS